MVRRQRPHQFDRFVDDADGVANRAAVAGYRVEPCELQNPLDQPVQPVVFRRNVTDDPFGQLWIADRAALENPDVPDGDRQRRSKFVTGFGEKRAQAIFAGGARVQFANQPVQRSARGVGEVAEQRIVVDGERIRAFAARHRTEMCVEQRNAARSLSSPRRTDDVRDRADDDQDDDEPESNEKAQPHDRPRTRHQQHVPVAHRHDRHLPRRRRRRLAPDRQSVAAHRFVARDERSGSIERGHVDVPRGKRFLHRVEPPADGLRILRRNRRANGGAGGIERRVARVFHADDEKDRDDGERHQRSAERRNDDRARERSS